MTDSNEYLDKTTAEFLTKFFQDIINGLAAQVEDRLKNLEKQMLEVMQNASKGILADENPRVASAVNNLASEKLSDTNA